MRRSLIAALVSASAFMMVAGVVGPLGAEAASQPRVVLKPVVGASGLHQPVQVTSAYDGSTRLFVVEKRGIIRVFNGRSVELRPTQTSGRRSTPLSERGLLGVAFSPNFRSNRYLWTTHTRKGDGALVVTRFRSSKPTSIKVSAGTARVVLVVKRPRSAVGNHNGGAIVFGKDGLLYISTGDGGGAGDPFNRAQSANTLNGKILRIDVRRSCGTRFYCIPPSNPYARSTTHQKTVFVRGFRNPWRMSVDPVTGFLWVGDVGQDRWEEVNVVRPTMGGRNFGWSCREGKEIFNASRCRSETLIGPSIRYCHPGAVKGCTTSVGGESVTGGLDPTAARSTPPCWRAATSMATSSPAISGWRGQAWCSVRAGSPELHRSAWTTVASRGP